MPSAGRGLWAFRVAQKEMLVLRSQIRQQELDDPRRPYNAKPYRLPSYQFRQAAESVPKFCPEISRSAWNVHALCCELSNGSSSHDTRLAAAVMRCSCVYMPDS